MKKKTFTKKTIIDPEFIEAMHANTTMDDHAVVLIQVKLKRTKTGYKESLIRMHSFPEGLYEMFKSMGIDVLKLDGGKDDRKQRLRTKR